MLIFYLVNGKILPGCNYHLASCYLEGRFSQWFCRQNLLLIAFRFGSCFFSNISSRKRWRMLCDHFYLSHKIFVSIILAWLWNRLLNVYYRNLWFIYLLTMLTEELYGVNIWDLSKNSENYIHRKYPAIPL